MKINGQWCLVDTTWGIPQDTYYLCNPPKCFIRDHLPEESQKSFQLLENPISLKTFEEYAHVKTTCCETNCEIIEDKVFQNKCSGKITYKYKYENKIRISVTYGYSDYWELPEFYIKKIEDGYDVFYQYNKLGFYSFAIFGSDEYSPSTAISYFFVNCTELPKKPFNYPKIEVFHSVYDIELISPSLIKKLKLANALV